MNEPFPTIPKERVCPRCNGHNTLEPSYPGDYFDCKDCEHSWPKLATNPLSKAGWVDGPRYRRGDRVWVSSDVDQWGRISCEGRVEEVYDDAMMVRIGGQIRANLMIPIEDCNALPFDVHSLKEGDEVYWNDPDNGECSRYFTIQSIEIRGDGHGEVSIVDKDGSALECYEDELA